MYTVNVLLHMFTKRRIKFHFGREKNKNKNIILPFIKSFLICLRVDVICDHVLLKSFFLFLFRCSSCLSPYYNTINWFGQVCMGCVGMWIYLDSFSSFNSCSVSFVYWRARASELLLSFCFFLSLFLHSITRSMHSFLRQVYVFFDCRTVFEQKRKQWFQLNRTWLCQ